MFRLILRNEPSWHLALKNFSLSHFAGNKNFMLACQLGTLFLHLKVELRIGKLILMTVLYANIPSRAKYKIDLFRLFA